MHASQSYESQLVMLCPWAMQLAVVFSNIIYPHPPAPPERCWKRPEALRRGGRPLPRLEPVRAMSCAPAAGPLAAAMDHVSAREP